MTVSSKKQPILARARAVFASFLARSKPSGVRVGRGVVELTGDPAMFIGGGLEAATSPGQDGKLRIVALVLQHGNAKKIALVTADVLFVTRDFIDEALKDIKKECGLSPENILVNASHTHHAPTTVTLHGYKRDEEFCRRVRAGIVEAVKKADAALSSYECSLHFSLEEESTFGQNSRLLLGDKTIYWTGPRDDALGPTGPIDPQFPVLAFKTPEGAYEAVLFNHATHAISSRSPNVKSPSIYGLVAQELEPVLGGNFLFLSGAASSTHNLALAAEDAIGAIKTALVTGLTQLAPQPLTRLVSVKRPFKFKVRRFDEALEAQKVSAYCDKRLPAYAQRIAEIFRNQRALLKDQQGKTRTTWIQVILLGEIALVGLPAEYFAVLGLDIKRRSPFPHTYIAALSNDWIGYTPDRTAHVMGGYQTWTGLHSYAEEGTGERLAEEALSLLRALHRA